MTFVAYGVYSVPLFSRVNIKEKQSKMLAIPQCKVSVDAGGAGHQESFLETGTLWCVGNKLLLEADVQADGQMAQGGW